MYRRFAALGLACAAAYYLYIPLPEGYEEPWKTRFFLCVMGAAKNVFMVANYLGGYDHPLRLVQIVLEKYRKSSRCETLPGLKVTDYMFDGVPVRMYEPEQRSPNSPAVLYFHGGGWVLLNIDIYDCFVQQMALRTGVMFLSVDYRLAPDHIYPSAIDDCVTATKYLFNNAESFKVDPKRIAVAGDSAGGHLSTVVAMKLRDQKFPGRLAMQILTNPITQAFDLNTPSYKLYGKDYATLTKDWVLIFLDLFAKGRTSHASRSMLGSNKHVSKKMYEKYHSRCDPTTLIPKTYLGLSESEKVRVFPEKVDSSYENLVTDPYISPLLADDLSGLPKTYIITSEVDVLRDDGLMYVKRLQQAGNDVTHRHYLSSYHGFFASNPDIDSRDVNRETAKSLIDYINKNL